MTYIPFSQRLGYKEVPKTVIKESLPENVMNSIQNTFNELWNKYGASIDIYNLINRHFDRYYLNLRIDRGNYVNVFSYIDNDELEWYEKIDAIEWSINFLYSNFQEQDIKKLDDCICELNQEFSRHRFGYRIVKGFFIEITSNDELNSIETALAGANNNVAIHLKRAISSITPSNPVPDYRNSIKESISAVGSYLRDICGGNTLGEALSNLQKKHPQLINRFVYNAINSLYTYTNQPNTGIRHELLSQDYIPDQADALFMLIEASCIINYITNKLSLTK